MKQSHIVGALALCIAMASAGAARAGAPQPDTRQGDFEHVCKGGPNKDQACTVASEDTDCPKSECVVKILTTPIRGVLTVIAHDSVTDWSNGSATNQALTVMLEVKGPDGTKHLLAATYQDVATPANPPQAPSNVVAIPMDEGSLVNVAKALNGLLFVQPESTLAEQLQTIFSSTGTPVLVAVEDRRFQSADHSGDGLATVLRFKVKVQFLESL